MSLAVLVALTGGAEERLVREIAGASDLTVTRRCADLQELLAAAIAQVGTIAVTDTESGLDRVMVDRLGRAGVRTLVVAAPTEHVRITEIGARPADPDADRLRGTPDRPPDAPPRPRRPGTAPRPPGPPATGRPPT